MATDLTPPLNRHPWNEMPLGVALLGIHFYCTSCLSEDWRVVREAQLYPKCGCGRLFTDDDVVSMFVASGTQEAGVG